MLRHAVHSFLLFLLFAQPIQARTEPAKEAKDKAVRAFERGTALFKEYNYLEALEAFEEAYRWQPHFLVQCNIARCYERSGNLVKAAEYFRRCLKEGGAGAAMGDRVRSALLQVEKRITWILVQSPGHGGIIYVDGFPIGAAPAQIPLNPGIRVIEVRRVGAAPATTTIKTRGGEKRTAILIPIDLNQEATRTATVPMKKKRSLSSIWFWAAASLTVGLAGTAIALGIDTLGARQEYEDHPTVAAYDTAVNRRLITNVFWGLTFAAAGASTLLFFYTDFSRSGSPRPDSHRPVALGVGVQGCF